MTDLPYPIDDGRTHWEDCYRTARHHNCAVIEVDRLRVENERLREALDGLIDRIEDADLVHGMEDVLEIAALALAKARGETEEATDDT